MTTNRPLLDQVLAQVGSIEKLQPEFDRKGPYDTAKKYGVLVNNSAEDFAIQFMSAYNEEYPGSY